MDTTIQRCTDMLYLDFTMLPMQHSSNVLPVLWGFAFGLMHTVRYFEARPLSLWLPRSLSLPVILLWTWKPSIMNDSAGERSSSLFSLNTDCIINRSDWSNETQKHGGLWIRGRSTSSLLYTAFTNRKSGYNYTVKHSHALTFDNHKRLRACSYLINMTGFMDVSG